MYHGPVENVHWEAIGASLNELNTDHKVKQKVTGEAVTGVHTYSGTNGLSTQSRITPSDILDKIRFEWLKRCLDICGWRAHEARVMLGDATRAFGFHQDTFREDFCRLLLTGYAPKGQASSVLRFEDLKDPHSAPKTGERVGGATGVKGVDYEKNHGYLT